MHDGRAPRTLNNFSTAPRIPTVHPYFEVLGSITVDATPSPTRRRTRRVECERDARRPTIQLYSIAQSATQKDTWQRHRTGEGHAHVTLVSQGSQIHTVGCAAVHTGFARHRIRIRARHLAPPELAAKLAPRAHDATLDATSGSCTAPSIVTSPRAPPHPGVLRRTDGHRMARLTYRLVPTRLSQALDSRADAAHPTDVAHAHTDCGTPT